MGRASRSDQTSSARERDDPNPGGADLGQLFATAPEQFVAARDNLVAKLKASGSTKAASAIKGLPKPTLVVWVINQLGRSHPELVESLVESGDRLRQLQAHALRGRSTSADNFRAASQAQREAMGALIRAAGQVLDQRRAGGKFGSVGPNRVDLARDRGRTRSGERAPSSRSAEPRGCARRLSEHEHRVRLASRKIDE
jgi:hypothetical protein